MKIDFDFLYHNDPCIGEEALEELWGDNPGVMDAHELVDKALDAGLPLRYVLWALWSPDTDVYEEAFLRGGLNPRLSTCGGHGSDKGLGRWGSCIRCNVIAARPVTDDTRRRVHALVDRIDEVLSDE